MSWAEFADLVAGLLCVESRLFRFLNPAPDPSDSMIGDT